MTIDDIADWSNKEEDFIYWEGTTNPNSICIFPPWCFHQTETVLFIFILNKINYYSKLRSSIAVTYSAIFSMHFHVFTQQISCYRDLKEKLDYPVLRYAWNTIVTCLEGETSNVEDVTNSLDFVETFLAEEKLQILCKMKPLWKLEPVKLPYSFKDFFDEMQVDKAAFHKCGSCHFFPINLFLQKEGTQQTLCSECALKGTKKPCKVSKLSIIPM